MDKFLTAKNIFIVLGVVVVVEVLWAGWALLKPAAPPSAPVKLPVSTPKFTTVTLSSTSTSPKVGEKVTVAVNLSSDKKVDGVDLIILYDAKLLTPQLAGKDQIPVIAGAVFGNFPQNKIESFGRIAVSGITDQSGGVLADGLFGSVVFRTQATGSAKISLEFAPGKTTDSNVIESGTGADVLEKVNNLEVNILP